MGGEATLITGHGVALGESVEVAEGDRDPFVAKLEAEGLPESVGVLAQAVRKNAIASTTPRWLLPRSNLPIAAVCAPLTTGTTLTLAVAPRVESPQPIPRLPGGCTAADRLCVAH